MRSILHSDWLLVQQSIQTTIDNVVRNGGVVSAATEARRLAMTYPEAGVSEAEIRARFVQLAEAHGLPVAIDDPGAGTTPAVSPAPGSMPDAASVLTGLIDGLGGDPREG